MRIVDSGFVRLKVPLSYSAVCFILIISRTERNGRQRIKAPPKGCPSMRTSTTVGRTGTFSSLIAHLLEFILLGAMQRAIQLVIAKWTTNLLTFVRLPLVARAGSSAMQFIIQFFALNFSIFIFFKDLSSRRRTSFHGPRSIRVRARLYYSRSRRATKRKTRRATVKRKRKWFVLNS